jgi:hypothetical protein
MSEPVDLYDATYSHFDEPVLARVRREAFGEDIGQNSWLTTDECRTYCQWLRRWQRYGARAPVGCARPLRAG